MTLVLLSLTSTYPLRSLRGVPFLESALLLLLTSTRAYLGSSSPMFELPALPFSGRGGIGGGGGGGRQGDDSSRSCSASEEKNGISFRMASQNLVLE